nr:hypothetical protein AVEN_39256-1 [Araneus ventricosus]
MRMSKSSLLPFYRTDMTLNFSKKLCLSDKIHEGFFAFDERLLPTNHDGPMVFAQQIVLAVSRPAPLKPALGRKRHELNSPNLGGHLSHPLLYHFLKAQANELWLTRVTGPPYLARLLSDLGTSLPSKETNHRRLAFAAVNGKCLDRLRPSFLAVKGKCLDRSGQPRLV